MEVYARITQKVEINPRDVISELLTLSLGGQNQVDEKEGKYYIKYEVSLGTHSGFEKIEISKEQYDYIQALLIVNKYLKTHVLI